LAAPQKSAATGHRPPEISKGAAEIFFSPRFGLRGPRLKSKNFSALAPGAFSVKIAFVASTFTAITKKDGDWWIGWIGEVPGVNAQEKTKDELLASLKEILGEALEFNRAEARQAAEENYSEELVTL
jgi:predicted RNase H-like HicB family nuclease